MRVDDGRKGWGLLAKKKKAQIVVTRGRRACLAILDLSYVHREGEGETKVPREYKG